MALIPTISRLRFATGERKNTCEGLIHPFANIVQRSATYVYLFSGVLDNSAALPIDLTTRAVRQVQHYESGAISNSCLPPCPLHGHARGICPTPPQRASCTGELLLQCACLFDSTETAEKDLQACSPRTPVVGQEGSPCLHSPETSLHRHTAAHQHASRASRIADKNSSPTPSFRWLW